MLSDYLASSGLSSKECDIYLVVSKYGQTSCNVVADQLARERTSTYKLMMNMVTNGFLIVTKRGKTVLFAAVDIDTLHRQFTEKLEKVQRLEANYELIKQEYKNIIGANQSAPSVSIAEGTLGVSGTYDQMLAIIQQEGLIHIKCFASKTFASFSSNNKKLETMHHEFNTRLQQLGTKVYGLYGEGMNIMETLKISNNLNDNLTLPNSNDSVTLRAIGSHVFLFIFKQTPQIIHITSPEFGNLLQFLGEQLWKQNENVTTL